MKIEKIKINGEYIRLDSLLKLAGLVGTGGQAKMVVLDGLVKFNGEECLMRTKKIRAGDTVEFDGVTILVE